MVKVENRGEGRELLASLTAAITGNGGIDGEKDTTQTEL